MEKEKFIEWLDGLVKEDCKTDRFREAAWIEAQDKAACGASYELSARWTISGRPYLYGGVSDPSEATPTEIDYKDNNYGNLTYHGKVYHLTDMADYTSRLMQYPYHLAADGEEYQAEMSASAKDDDGNEYVVYWIHWLTRGQEPEDLSDLDYETTVDRIEMI